MTDDRSNVEIKDLTWTASGGFGLDSSIGPRYVFLIDDSPPCWSRWLFWPIKKPALRL